MKLRKRWFPYVNHRLNPASPDARLLSNTILYTSLVNFKVSTTTVTQSTQLLPGCCCKNQKLRSWDCMTRCSSSHIGQRPVVPVWQFWWFSRSCQGQLESIDLHRCTEQASSCHSFLHFGYVFCPGRDSNIGCTVRRTSLLNWESCWETRHQKERRTLSLVPENLNNHARVNVTWIGRLLSPR